ncbi:hypothetical protein SPRG_07766 [Saprolegnia parasitica CBS 223.65]|uniref:B30.2/SPRY domain-containing protein n=1 Tax=Saprolegnia parasitica (strain CBS 223.65) TaxID=695850 RepID=A0A067CCZ6_SAPPC|nr:hypothetical protein SPRG_07766 [Saprolegnia parasitica CBS 223.65]KDO27055.1 hypothetical protein SPRG_07766 [Saprolegnia parasitica CBS 223.65]|eukprot:XP_012202150.1 hypothetical protein SPRG_07766 [Saprolegnia parasitica CBS 223.65]
MNSAESDMARPLPTDLLDPLDKMTSETRSQRLMTELAALSADRDHVVSMESLTYLSVMGRVEAIKLAVEKPLADAPSKGTDRVSADAARRQRVEELTRFFMEAKSDIEFALSGGLGRRERARQDQIDSDGKSDEEKSDASMQEASMDDAKPDSMADEAPPSPERTHFQLLSDPIDARVFHPLLLSIRDSDPLLYGTILCHPLVAVHDPRREKQQKAQLPSKTKKKKQKNDIPAMYQPDFAAPLLTDDEATVHAARFVARALADGTIPALLLAAQVVLSFDLSKQYPLVSHLKVLRGEAAPGEAAPAAPKVQPKKPLVPSSDVVLDTADFMSSVMELEGTMGPLAALRSRLGRLEDSMDEDMDAMSNSSSSQLPLEEVVDEEALMARAIALSLSPELQVTDADAIESKVDADTLLPENAPKSLPTAYSPDELTAFAVFDLSSASDATVAGSVVLQYLWTGVHVICREYVELAETKRTVSASNPIVPNPLAFLLLQSMLARVGAHVDGSDRDALVFTSGAVVLLHALDAYLFHVHVMGIAPASVGLGQSSTNANPLPLALKNVLLHYMAGIEGPDAPLDPVVFTDASASLSASVARYRACLPAQARVTWARGIAHFYPTHSERHALLHSLLGQLPHAHAQVDLLCTRLAIPDLALGFVPALHEEYSAETRPRTLLDDDAFASSKLCIWPPSLVRESLEANTCRSSSVLDFLLAVAPGLFDVATSTDASLDTVANMYAQAFESQADALKQTWSHLLPTMQKLTDYVAHEPVLRTVAFPTPAFSSTTVPLLGKAPNARLQLLRALQDGLLASLHGSIAGDEPTRLEFDGARCADTLTLVDGQSSAKQHTAKQWGMVLSTYGCAPNTGLHEWAVRLDRCEKGHVFLGVSTREASVATYVGGDRHGWGLIGTRALWHNRSKVRGDYGDGFSTGSVVRIRLNTDTGALSFGLLDDDSDWGIAFDGLTQHGTLYPAIGLYQRDDQVTLVPASIGASSATISADHAITPLYQEVVLHTFFEYVHSVVGSLPNFWFALGVPLFSSLCLLVRQAQRSPNHPLATMFALHLLPKCLEVLLHLDGPKSTTNQQRQLGLVIGGKWELKSMAAGTIPAQQYVLDLDQSPDGGMRGHSASSSVAVEGTIQGTRVSFVETWTQGGTCLVQGRLRIDGRVFHGTYEDTKSHTIGGISGSALLPRAPPCPDLKLVIQMVVGTLIGAYNTVLLTSDPEPSAYQSFHASDETDNTSPLSPEATTEEYEEWVQSPLFSGGLPELLPHVTVVAQRFAVPTSPWSAMASRWSQAVTPALTSAPVEPSTFLADLIAGRNDVDANITKHAGESPFLRLGGDAMKTARRMICACMLWHTGLTLDNMVISETERPNENVLHIWRAAQRVVEWSVRMKQQHSHSYSDMATYLMQRARFLLQLQNPLALNCASSERLFSETLMHVSRFLQATGTHLGKLHQMLLRNAGRAYFRAMGLHSMRFVLELGLTNSSSALCHALQWLHLDPLAEKTALQKLRMHHFDHGIHGCGRVLHGHVKDAWEALYAHLASTLSRATWAKDADLQLVVLQAWGVLITPDDHAFVSRVGIFRILQTVLDEARSSAVVPKHIVQAALKVVHLLAAQVATGTLPEETSVATSIPLSRKPSGPETLGKSVFEMLFTELRNAQEGSASKEAQQYGLQICGLLYSVTLVLAQVVAPLLRLVETGSSPVQRRVLQLLRRLLPHIHPRRCVQWAEADDDMEDDSMMLDDPAPGHTPSSLVVFFLTLTQLAGPSSPSRLSPGSSHGLVGEVVHLLRSLFVADGWKSILHDVLLDALSKQETSFVSEADALDALLPQWTEWYRDQMQACAALCVLGGHIEGLQVGHMVKLAPRPSSSDVVFKGAKGVLVGMDLDKSSVEVLLHKGSEWTGAGASTSTTNNRPIRVALEDIVQCPEVEWKDMEPEVIQRLVVHHTPQFLQAVLSIAAPSTTSSSEDENKEPKDAPLSLDAIRSVVDEEQKMLQALVGLHGIRAMGPWLHQPACPVWLQPTLPLLCQVATLPTSTSGLTDLSILEEQWLLLYRKWLEEHQSKFPKEASPTSGAAATDADAPKTAPAAAAPPSALCLQMMEMGFPREWCEVALAKCAYQVEVAINFCFEHSGEMDRLVQQATQKAKAPAPRKERAEPSVPPMLLEQLSEMGFPVNWCKKALLANRNNVDAALTWILSNGEALEAEDRREEEKAKDVVEHVERSTVRQGPNPLRHISGQASISDDLLVEGMAGGGFASVGAPDCIVFTGRWYYEATLLTSGCIQIGWADAAFSGASERGTGVGDGPHSWAYDGWRQQKWHGLSSPYGRKWKVGDVIGCGVDCDAGTISFASTASTWAWPSAALTFNRRERLAFNFGGLPFCTTSLAHANFAPILRTLPTDPTAYVKGSLEDSLEECMGEEQYASDARYFGKDLKAAATIPGRAKLQNAAALQSSPSSASLLGDWMQLTRQLAILHARKALLAIWSQWPVDLAVPDVPAESFYTFLKLVAPYATLATGDDAILSSLDTLRPLTLQMLASHPGIATSMLSALSDHVALAGTRKYAKIPWDAPNELVVVSSLAQLNDAPWTDNEVLTHPNVHFAEWVTFLLLEHSRPSVREALLQAWLCVLKSPSLCLKDKAAQLLSRFVPEMPLETISRFPLERLVALCTQRLAKEYVHFPICSKYLQHLMELTSTLCIAHGDVLPTSSLAQRVLAAKAAYETLQPLELLESPHVDEAEKQDESMGDDDDDDDGMTPPPPPPPMDLAAIAQMNAEDKNGLPVDTPVATAARAPVPPFPLQLVDSSLLTPEQRVHMEAAYLGFKSGAPVSWPYGFDMGVVSDDAKAHLWTGAVTQLKVQRPVDELEAAKAAAEVIPPLGIGCKVKRGPHWKWRDQDGGDGMIGTVEGISPWSGVEGEGMSVRWPNEALYTYRWGADGNYDLTHVEVDDQNNVVRTYPTPKPTVGATLSAADILANPFSVELHFGMVLRVWSTHDGRVEGVVEWPDHQAIIAVAGTFADHTLQLQEVAMLQGDMDMGWSLRFGCERWLPGTKYSLVVDASTCWGDAVYYGWHEKAWSLVKSQVRLQSELLFSLDPHAANPALQVATDGQSVQCLSGDSRNLVLGTVGFSAGVHYWELRVDQAEFGSVFLGVCEKQTKGTTVVNLNRWQGWGFVNFRATYHNSTERIYGDHFNAGDTIGVCLNMESGKLSFFMDGIKYGEHIVTDLGTAFEGLKHDNQSPKTLYPCIGLRKAGDKVTLNGKWISSPGVPPALVCKTAMAFSSLVHRLVRQPPAPLPESFVHSGYRQYHRWLTQHTLRVLTRGRLSVDLDTAVTSCQRVCDAAQAPIAFFAGDRVRILSKGGRALDAPEEAVVLGVYRDRLWYRVETQGNEGSEEGRSYAWYWDGTELPELILVKRDGVDVSSGAIPAPAPSSTPALHADELVALSSLGGYQALALAPVHSLSTDVQLIEHLNGLCATHGVDAVNLSWSHIQAVQLSLPVDGLETPMLRARLALLLAFQQLVLQASPLLCFDDGSRTSRELLTLRRLVCTSTKLSLWDSVLRATTTATPLPSDEYEDPREIRVLRINRIQAQASKLALCPAPSDRLRKSVFGQLYREMRTWSDSGFRRAYIGKGHGGQKRAFKVKFLGEGVNDYGGPYRAVFEQIVDELQMDQVEVTKGEQGLLPLLVPCPNRRAGTGSNQDKFVLNPSCGTISVAVGPIALELHRFLGKLIGMAVRHGLQMGLDVPSVVWRPLVGLPLHVAHLREIDVVAANMLEQVQDDALKGEPLVFTTHLSDGTEVPLLPDGDARLVDSSNRAEYVELSLRKRLNESSPQLQALRDGLASVLPMELTGLFTAREFEVLVCGRRQVDVNLLQQCTEYEDVDPQSNHIQFFWQVLHEMSNEDRTLFLRFVWARSRMPNSAKEFPMNFKIQAPHDQGARQTPDAYLPHAQTCFFSLSLPAYSTKEILRVKLLYAIQNSPNMDADVRLHNAEGWADA